MTRTKLPLTCALALCLLMASWNTVLAQIYPALDTSPFELGITHPKPWDLSIRAFIGYNDNVPLVAYHTSCDKPSHAPCDRQSFYGGLSINANYRLIQDQQWLAGLGLSFDQVFYEHSAGPPCCTTDAKDYNLTTLSPSMFGRHFFPLVFGRMIMPASAGMSYTYRREWLPITGPLIWQSSTNTLKWDLSVDVIRQLKLGFDYTLSFQDFNPNEARSMSHALVIKTQAATANALGFSGTYLIQGGLRSIMLGYQWGTTDARGNNFDVTNRNGVKAEFKTWIRGPLWLALDVGSTWEDYKGFHARFIPPPGRKWQRIEDYGPTLLYVVTDHITVDLFYRYTGWVSNSRSFEAHRNNGGTGVTYRF